MTQTTAPLLSPADPLQWRIMDSEFGPMLIMAGPAGLRRVSFGAGVQAFLAAHPADQLTEGGPWVDQWIAVVRAVVAGEDAADMSAVPLDPRGTQFQQSVWALLQQIPAGTTCSYADLSAKLGIEGADRAVGSANGANPIAIIIPCHRVIRRDGALGGYAFGVEMKRALLEREGAIAPRLL